MIVRKSGVVFDRGELKKAEVTPQGFLRAPVFATRTGVFTYRSADGEVRRELRHPEDVFAPASLASLAGVPLTDDHPNVKDPEILLLTPENVRDFMVGYTGDDVGTEDRFVTAVVTVTDASAMAKVAAGKTEVSCGYTRELEEAEGIYDGIPYDCRQRNIIYNHMAIVDRGRAGPEVKIRLDAADAVQVEEASKPLEEKRMEKVNIGGVEYDCSPELKKAIDAMQAAKKDADNSTEVKSGELKEQTAKTDAANARADGLAAELVKAKARTDGGADPAKIREAVKARAKLEKVAERVLAGDALKAALDGDDKAIKVAVIKAEHKDAALDGKSDAYVDARFDAIAETLDAGDARGRDMGRALADGRTDADVPDADKARNASMERSKNLWKGAAAAK